MAHSNAINKETARLAFYDSLEFLARLGSFASANFRRDIGDGLYVLRAVELAQRDLLLLAISIRRLAENCNLEALLKAEQISHVRPYKKLTDADFYPIATKQSAWSLLGIIIHHRELEVFKDDVSVKSLLGEFEDDVVTHYTELLRKRDISAACYIKSDKGDPVLFAIREVCRVAVTFLDEAEEKLSELGVYVGNYAFD